MLVEAWAERELAFCSKVANTVPVKDRLFNSAEMTAIFLILLMRSSLKVNLGVNILDEY